MSKWTNIMQTFIAHADCTQIVIFLNDVCQLVYHQILIINLNTACYIYMLRWYRQASILMYR